MREDDTPHMEYISILLQAIPAAPQVYCENRAVNDIV